MANPKIKLAYNNAEMLIRCENCNNVFKQKDVATVEANCDGFNAFNPMLTFKFVDASGKIVGGNIFDADKEKGDMLLACPKCKHVHLFGFDRA